MKNGIIKLINYFLLFSIISCAGMPDPDATKLTAAEYFQKAYEATDQNNYSLALRYYEAFQKNFPDDLEKNLWAEFEIAFTYYKMGNFTKALELFNVLIDKYQEENISKATTAPKELALRVKEKILKQKK